MSMLVLWQFRTIKLTPAISATAYSAGDGNLYAYFVCDATPDFTKTTALTFLVHVGLM